MTKTRYDTTQSQATDSCTSQSASPSGFLFSSWQGWLFRIRYSVERIAIPIQSWIEAFGVVQTRFLSFLSYFVAPHRAGIMTFSTRKKRHCTFPGKVIYLFPQRLINHLSLSIRLKTANGFDRLFDFVGSLIEVVFGGYEGLL